MVTAVNRFGTLSSDNCVTLESITPIALSKHKRKILDIVKKNWVKLMRNKSCKIFTVKLHFSKTKTEKKRRLYLYLSQHFQINCFPETASNLLPLVLVSIAVFISTSFK